MNTNPTSLVKLFEQARQQAHTPPEASLLSEQDLKQLLNSRSRTPTQKKRPHSVLLGLAVPFLSNWRHIAFAGGLGLVLLMAIIGFMPIRRNSEEKLFAPPNAPSQVSLEHKRPSIVTHAFAQGQSRTNKTIASAPHRKKERKRAMPAQFSASKHLASLQSIVLSDDTPCYNPEFTMSPEEKLMRDMLLLVPIASTMTEFDNE